MALRVLSIVCLATLWVAYFLLLKRSEGLAGRYFPFLLGANVNVSLWPEFCIVYSLLVTLFIVRKLYSKDPNVDSGDR